MLRNHTLQPVRLSFLTIALTLKRRYFRSAAPCGLKSEFPGFHRWFLTASLLISFAAVIYPQSQFFLDQSKSSSGSGPNAQLIEQVPDRFAARYKRWKAMLLSVESGRKLWKKFTGDPGFRLTIIVSKKKKNGALVEDYMWERGKLVGVTVVLGSRLDHGYPVRQKYPVLGSLASDEEEESTRNDVLAAAKFAHELGHVEHAASDPAKFQRQNQLVSTFMQVFYLNGYDSADPELKALADRLGGAPTDISSERENRAEVAALNFLVDVLEPKEGRRLLKKVRKFIKPEFKYLFTSAIEAAEERLLSDFAGDPATSLDQK